MERLGKRIKIVEEEDGGGGQGEEALEWDYRRAEWKGERDYN